MWISIDETILSQIFLSHFYFILNKKKTYLLLFAKKRSSLGNIFIRNHMKTIKSKYDLLMINEK